MQKTKLDTLEPEQMRTLIQAAIADSQAAYDMLHPDYRTTALSELTVCLGYATPETYGKFTDVLKSTLPEDCAEFKAAQPSFKNTQRMESLLYLVEITLNSDFVQQKEAYLPSLIGLLENGGADIELHAARVLANYGDERAVTALTGLYEKDRSNATYAGFLLNARGVRDLTTAFDIDLTRVTEIDNAPGFMLTFQYTMIDMFESDGQKAFDAVRRNAIGWSQPILELTQQVLHESTDCWAKNALQFINTLVGQGAPVFKM